MHEIFNSLGLKIIAQTNQKVTNFLDINLDMRNSLYKPYKKPNDKLLYVHSNSNHPPSLLKQLPTSSDKHLSELSSDTQLSKKQFHHTRKPSTTAISVRVSRTRTTKRPRIPLLKDASYIAMLPGSTLHRAKTSRPTKAESFSI